MQHHEIFKHMNTVVTFCAILRLCMTTITFYR